MAMDLEVTIDLGGGIGTTAGIMAGGTGMGGVADTAGMAADGTAIIDSESRLRSPASYRIDPSGSCQSFISLARPVARVPSGSGLPRALNAFTVTPVPATFLP